MKVLQNERGATIVLSLLMIAGLSMLGISSLNVSDTELRIVQNQELASRAFFLAEAGIQHAAGVARQQGMAEAENLDGKFPLGDGSYDLNIQMVSDPASYLTTLTVFSRGETKSASRDLAAVIEKFNGGPHSSDKNFHNLHGGLTIVGENPLIDFDNNSNRLDISGNDHDLSDKYKNWKQRDATERPKDKLGLFTSDPNVTYGKKDDSQIKVDGGTGSAEDERFNDFPNKEAWDEWMDYLKSIATVVIEETTRGKTELVFGDLDNPEIVYWTLEASRFDGNVKGAGILIVADGAQFRGEFYWEGLVILDAYIPKTKNNDYNARFGGRATILGSLLVLGDDTKLRFNANAYIGHSSQAMEKVEKFYEDIAGDDANPPTPPRIVRWEDRSYF